MYLFNKFGYCFFSSTCVVTQSKKKHTVYFRIMPVKSLQLVTLLKLTDLGITI